MLVIIILFNYVWYNGIVIEKLYIKRKNVYRGERSGSGCLWVCVRIG